MVLDLSGFGPYRKSGQVFFLRMDVMGIKTHVSVALLVCFCFGQDALAYNASWMDALCNVYVGEGRFRSKGTGILIDESEGHGFMLTNRHVVGSRTEVLCVWENGYQSRGSVIWSDLYPDLALIRVPVPEGSVTLPVIDGNDLPAIGSQVQLAGFGGERNTLMSVWNANVIGYRMRYLGSTKSWKTIVIDTVTIGGDSGGAVIYNDRLVSVMWGGHAVRTGLLPRQVKQIDTRGTLAEYVYSACPT
jgi:S1-C subfamily serine protease